MRALAEKCHFPMHFPPILTLWAERCVNNPSVSMLIRLGAPESSSEPKEGIFSRDRSEELQPLKSN